MDDIGKHLADMDRQRLLPNPESAFEQKKRELNKMLLALAAKRSGMPVRTALKRGLALTPETLLAQVDYVTWFPVLRTLEPFCSRDQWPRLLADNLSPSTLYSPSPEIRSALEGAACGWAQEHHVKLTPETLMGSTNTYTRLPVLLALREFCDLGGWYRLLGEWWSGCDNISDYRGQLLPMFKSDSRVHVERMMTDEERAARNALPATVTAYRGCYKHNMRGLCYSLDREVAAEFPFKLRFRSTGQPLLVTVRMRRSRAILKLDREEREVIAINPRIINIEELSEKRLKSGRYPAPDGRDGRFPY